MPTAAEHNEIRRAKKGKQAAEAHARAQSSRNSPDDKDDDWDRSLTGYLDLHDLSQTGPCKYYGIIVKKNIVDLMKSGHIVVNLREDEPMYGGERIYPTPNGFRLADGTPVDNIRKVTAYIEPPYAIIFNYVQDNKKNNGDMLMLVL